uniref:TOG domain-containing protein n=1 Tax=Manihot esculenta TaxID=3983 RepID=A0A2C9UWN3_MANES
MNSEEDKDGRQRQMLKVMETLKIFEDRMALNKSEEDNAQKALEDLIELTKDRSDLILNQIDEIFEIMHKILESLKFEERTRFLAVEIVAQLFSNIREPEAEPFLAGRFICRMFSMLKVIDDNPAWDYDKLEKSCSVHSQGKKGLARLAATMGGQLLLGKFGRIFESHYDSEEWESRHAAIVANALVACTCSEELINKLDLVVQPVMQVVEDTHFRVRWAALDAIEEFSKKLSPEFQHQYYNQVLPALIKASNYLENLRIQLKAVKAISYFSQNCESDLLTPYMNEILSMLLRYLQDSFQEYYRTVMPYMKVIMMKAAAESNFTLLAQSVECTTIFGLSVGKEIFNHDIEMVLQFLISSEASKIKTEHPMRNQLLKVWGRLCKCLGQDFQPYSVVAIPLLLQSAQLALHATSLDISQSKYSFESVLTLQDQKIEINSKVLEEKATACEVLCICADELKEGFDLWIDEAAQTIVPLINCDIHEGLRKISISAIPVILKSSKAAMEKECTEGSEESSFKGLCSYIALALVEALNKEKLMEMQVRILESLNECMEISGATLNTEQINYFLHIIMEIITTGSALSGSKVENEQTEKIRNTAVGCLTTFTKAYKTSLSQFLDQLLSCMACMWENGRKAEERRLALHIFSDVAEKCQEEALMYCEDSLRFLIDACYEKNSEVQQIVAQGIGVSAEFGGSIFKSHIKEALAGLKAILRDQETLHLDNLPAHVAAVSALGKICFYHHERLDEVFDIWLSHLPIVCDRDEDKIVHDQLCSTVEKFKGELIRRDNDTRLSQLLAVFAEMFLLLHFCVNDGKVDLILQILWVGDNAATEETVKRVIEQLKHFNSRLPPDTWASIMFSLMPCRAKNLQLILSLF